MSTRIRKALADLEHDTSSLRLAPPAQIRARGEAWRRHRVTGGVATAAAGTITATIFGVAAVGGGSATSPPPVGASPTVNSSAAAETDCGRHVLRQAEKLPDAVIACFLDAVAAKRPARLAETRPTVEGDPIQILYVADTTGAVQVTTDSRQDAYGDRNVVRQTCTGPVADHGHIGFAQCSSPAPA
jgi:hypothetical protein